MKGFWDLKEPGSRRPCRAALLGPPGAFFRAVVGASAQVELYDEELGYEPFRLGVRTITAAKAGLPAALRPIVAKGLFPLLIGYETAPDLQERPLTVLFAPGCPPGEERAVRADVVLGLRCGGAGGAGKVLTAREIAAGAGMPSLRASAGGVLCVIDPHVMDPSLLAVPGNIEPGGLQWHPLTSLLRQLLGRTGVKALLVLPCRLPRRDPAPAFVLARLVSKTLAYALAGERKNMSP